MGRASSAIAEADDLSGDLAAGVHAGDDFLAEVATLGEVDRAIELAGLGGEDGVVEIDAEDRPAGFDSGGVERGPTRGRRGRRPGSWFSKNRDRNPVQTLFGLRIIDHDMKAGCSAGIITPDDGIDIEQSRRERTQLRQFNRRRIAGFSQDLHRSRPVQRQCMQRTNPAGHFHAFAKQKLVKRLARGIDEACVHVEPGSVAAIDHMGVGDDPAFAVEEEGIDAGVWRPCRFWWICPRFGW